MSAGHSSGVSGGIGRVGVGSSSVGRIGGGVSSVGIGGYGGVSAYRGIGAYGGYRGFYPGYYGYRGLYGYGGLYWPYTFGLGYYSDPYYYSDYGYYPYDYGYGYQYGYPSAYQPNVTAVYPEQQSAPAMAYAASPVMRRYDEYGQEIAPGSGGSVDSSPLYLIAFKDHTILPAISYSVTGDTFNYVTLDREDKHVPLASVDRDLSRQLNRERRVAFNLPNQ
jgi:hypothetical protein